MSEQHWGEKHLARQCHADKSDQEIAGMVRMLIRSDIDHESVCVAARDRIARLSFQLDEMAKARDALLDRLATLESGAGPFTHRASDALALAVFDWIERRIIPTRSPVSDALESWAACRFDCTDGTEIQKLREFAASKSPAKA